MVMKAVSSEGTGQWEMGALQRNMGAIFKRIKGDNPFAEHLREHLACIIISHQSNPFDA